VCTRGKSEISVENKRTNAEREAMVAFLLSRGQVNQTGKCVLTDWEKELKERPRERRKGRLKVRRARNLGTHAGEGGRRTLFISHGEWTVVVKPSKEKRMEKKIERASAENDHRQL